MQALCQLQATRPSQPSLHHHLQNSLLLHHLPPMQPTAGAVASTEEQDQPRCKFHGMCSIGPVRKTLAKQLTGNRCCITLMGLTACSTDKRTQLDNRQ
jgi:hypothetical protein